MAQASGALVASSAIAAFIRDAMLAVGMPATETKDDVTGDAVAEAA